MIACSASIIRAVAILMATVLPYLADKEVDLSVSSTSSKILAYDMKSCSDAAAGIACLYFPQIA